MARDLTAEVADLVNSGQAVQRQGNKFGKRVRNVDQDPMDVGDQFVIPAGYTVLEAPVVQGGDPVPFILVTVKNKNTGVTRNTRFFPNQLAKVIYPIVNGVRQAKLKTKGSAALHYQTFADQGDEGMDNAVQSMVGRVIEITAKTPYTVAEYGTNKEVPTALYQYDWAQTGSTQP